MVTSDAWMSFALVWESVYWSNVVLLSISRKYEQNHNPHLRCMSQKVTTVNGCNTCGIHLVKIVLQRHCLSTINSTLHIVHILDSIGVSWSQSPNVWWYPGRCVNRQSGKIVWNQEQSILYCFRITSSSWYVLKSCNSKPSSSRWVIGCESSNMDSWLSRRGTVDRVS